MQSGSGLWLRNSAYLRKARLTSVAIRIRIHIRSRDPDCLQNLITCSQPSLKNACKSVWKFLRKVANRQTNWQTNKQWRLHILVGGGNHLLLKHCSNLWKLCVWVSKLIMLQFGDKEKVWQLKLLNGLVYVRFGASVMPLDEFLANNDPCRGWFTLLSTYINYAWFCVFFIIFILYFIVHMCECHMSYLLTLH